MAKVPHTTDEDEQRKRITSIAVAGDSIVLLDNIVGQLGGASLDAALTATTWSDRLLGATAMVCVPLVVTWFATGNNTVLAGDTSRRCLHIRLESPDEAPEERAGFHHADLLAWVRAERPRLVAAALTILRSYCATGRPDMELPPWGSFDGWSRLVRHALVWAGEPDPGETRRELREVSDRDVAALRDLVDGWAMVAGDRAITVAAALAALQPATATADHPLRRALTELCPDRGAKPGELPSPHRVGKLIAKYRGRVVAGRALVRATAHTREGVRWAVEAPRPVRGRPGGERDGGDGGDDAYRYAGAGARECKRGETSSQSSHSSRDPGEEG